MIGTPEAERYIPGHDASAIGLMAARTSATHARFLLPHLASGMTLLDLGCGPVTITTDLAAVAPEHALGLDQQAAQHHSARALTQQRGRTNISRRRAPWRCHVDATPHTPGRPGRITNRGGVRQYCEGAAV